MSELKLCQGTRCHTYSTKDRLKGVKGSKTFQTRRRSNFYYGSMETFVLGIVKSIGLMISEIEQLITSED